MNSAPQPRPAIAWGARAALLGTLCCAAGCSSSDPPALANAAAGGSGTAVRVFPPTIDPAAFGNADLSKIAFSAFSQSDVSGRDPQVLALAPDLVPRTWGQWDTTGLQASDYDFSYPRDCQAKGITFIGGLTASVIFQDEMSADDFADEVGRDAANNPVPHSEIVPNAFRGSLASPGFRQRLIEIAKIQIDGGVDGLFFDEVNSSFIGASYQGNEGFDDHFVADFGRFLCDAVGGAKLSTFGVTASDRLDCGATDPGASFDYRAYLARHNATASPQSAANPLYQLWGTTEANRPDPSVNSFVQTAPTLVYWQEIVLAVRKYARDTYGKEVLITSNGVFPFVDFQSVGLYEWNHDGPGPMGFDWLPVASSHFTGSAGFATALAGLKARSKRIVEAASGQEVPLLLFLDWPTDTINRYYALPLSERQDYVRACLAEASALGMWFAVPLATTTDTNTATALGMMSTLQALRDFYTTHRALFTGAADAAGTVQTSLPGLGTRLVTLPDGRLALYLVNHDYSAGFVPHAGVTLSFPVPSAPQSVALASPDLNADAPAMFTFNAGTLTVTVDTLQSSLVVVVQP